MTQKALADEIDVSLQTVNMLINAKRGITAEMALRLSACFQNSAEYWMDLQRDYDLMRHRQRLDNDLEAIRARRSRKA